VFQMVEFDRILPQDANCTSPTAIEMFDRIFAGNPGNSNYQF
jgi:hypothetical protein